MAQGGTDRDDGGLGEDGLIQTFLAPLVAGAPGARGLRDDCASLSPPPGMDLVLKTDPIRAGIHFFPDDAPADIAWKALAVNVSDLAAKGARPLVYLLALSFPDFPGRAWMSAFADGLRSAQTAFGCHLTGGDTDRAPGPLSIAVTAIGAVPAGRLVPRTGAQPGDALYVSGTIGCAALGLAIRAGDTARWGMAAAGLDEVERAALLRRYLRPQPRLALAAAVLDHASAAMDVSDGLVKDAARLCRASGVAGRIIGPQVPLGAVSRRLVDRDPGALSRLITAGDDYEILCAVPPRSEAGFRAAADKAGISVTRIGDLSEGAGMTILDAAGNPLAIAATGWDHFGGHDGA